MRKIGGAAQVCGWCTFILVGCSLRTGSGNGPIAPPVSPGVCVPSDPTCFPGNFNTARTAGGPGFAAYRCQFRVPSTPALESRNQALYLWCGVQQAGVPEGQEFGVLQPVLMFGADCVQDLPEGKNFGPENDRTYLSRPYWYTSAQYVYPDAASPTGFKCTSGSVFAVAPGEILNSAITYDESADTMTVRVSASDGRTSNPIVKHPKDNSRSSWRQFVGGDHLFFNAVLEVPNPMPRRPLPEEVLRGWRLTAAVETLSALPQLKPEAWQLVGDPRHALSIQCAHDSSRLESVCTWSNRVP